MKPLGTSEKAVLAWLKEHPGSKSQGVGDALYDATSSCAKGPYADIIATPLPRLRAIWASKVLQRLKKRRFVRLSNYNNPRWSVIGLHESCPDYRHSTGILCSCQSREAPDCSCHIIRKEGNCPRRYK